MRRFEKCLARTSSRPGSLVAPDRLRFDFVHASPVSREQIVQIERIVNEQIYRNSPVITEERSTQEAMASGAMALFGEKYGDRVRVVSIPGFSMELCGGTHCRATGDIGFFTIVSEGGVAAGVRRIEAVTGAAAVEVHQSTRAALDEMLARTGHDPGARSSSRRTTPGERRSAWTREISKLKVEGARSSAESASDGRLRGSAVARAADWSRNWRAAWAKTSSRQLADAHRDRIQRSVIVVIGSVDERRVSLVVAVTQDLVPTVHAGHLVKELAPVVGGRGGGRPDFAEAGGKDPSQQVPQALLEAEGTGRFFRRSPKTSLKSLHTSADTPNRSVCVETQNCNCVGRGMRARWSGPSPPRLRSTPGGMPTAS